MPQEHWLDALSKAALRAATRREIARAFAVLIPGLILGRLADNASAGNTRKRKRKGNNGKNNRHKHKHKRPKHLGDPDPSRDDCDAFLSEPWLQSDCRTIRDQCEAPDQFCIYSVEHEGEEDLRGVACCSDPKECCLFGCADTRNDRKNCGSCHRECGPSEFCRDRQCINLCANQAYPFDTWTQYCGGVCIPATALCCDDYWCWHEQEVACCYDVNQTCRTAEESCVGA